MPSPTNRNLTRFWFALISLGLVLSITACSGGDGGNDQGNVIDAGSANCTLGAEETNSSNACNLCESTTCFCSTNGWIATGTSCDSCDASVIDECTEVCDNGYQKDDNGCDTCACAEGPVSTCTEGEEKSAGDPCNTCTCGSDGTWTCTTDVCASECEPGETKISDDGCNPCGCDDNGFWVCGTEPCEGCNPGEVKLPPDDCCTCNDNSEWECAASPCPSTCEEGDVKEKGDGCNTCTCDVNNTWICTEETCGEGADCPPGKENSCEKKAFWGKNLVTGTCCEYDSPCAIPDGLEKFADAVACEEAPWEGWDGNPEPTQVTDEGVPDNGVAAPLDAGEGSD